MLSWTVLSNWQSVIALSRHKFISFYSFSGMLGCRCLQRGVSKFGH
jgi:hypothetical protein